MYCIHDVEYGYCRESVHFQASSSPESELEVGAAQKPFFSHTLSLSNGAQVDLTPGCPLFGGLLSVGLRSSRLVSGYGAKPI